MPAEEKETEGPRGEAVRDSAAAAQQETKASSKKGAQAGGAKRLRIPMSPLLLGAIAVAIAASGVSIGVVLKAAGLQSECHRMQQMAADPAGLGRPTIPTS